MGFPEVLTRVIDEEGFVIPSEVFHLIDESDDDDDKLSEVSESDSDS